MYFFKGLSVCHETTITFMHLSFRPSLTDSHSQKTAQLRFKKTGIDKNKKIQSILVKKREGFWLSLESLIDKGNK